MSLIPKTPASIIQRAQERGDLDRSSDTIYAAECNAAEWSIQNGVYIIWVPHPSATIPASATDDIRSGSGQCSRVGESSLCMCGHPLISHNMGDVMSKIAKYKGRNPGYLKPPTCKHGGCRCKEYMYAPCYPEECGQWWLKGRRDFNLQEWRKRVRTNPLEYACIGCNLKLTDHETLIETRDQRLSRHPEAKIDQDYIPLNEYRDMMNTEGNDVVGEMLPFDRKEMVYSVPRGTFKPHIRK